MFQILKYPNLSISYYYAYHSIYDVTPIKGMLYSASVWNAGFDQHQVFHYFDLK